MKDARTHFVLMILIFYFLSDSDFAQVNILTKDKNGILPYNTYKPGVITTAIIKGDSTVATYSLDLNEDVSVIVQFKEPPISIIQAPKQRKLHKEISSALSRIEYEHASFLSDITKIENSVISKPNLILKASNTQISFQYKIAINGMAVKTKRWVVEELKKLPYVKSVFEDKEVKMLDDQSNHIIGADSVWTKMGITGTGIKIGILDTGIDYTHPDLGGGIGSAFKVLGGYDLINNDNDPMDDNGHGTHVAGITAANGTSLKGVAPNASLYAFKVLDKSGGGLSSVIISGIERALDPDQNPSTNDAVDIINMSLGGPGNPDDILSQAIDNATAAGVICVIAAGNGGPYYQTIGSPGCARTALTVGASDNIDKIATFSSRGPSNSIYAIKPDIIAPGVSINSAKMGGGYIAYKGTSMATPHVAGCAALLLQLHPNWTPSMIKSVLMESAKDIGIDIWAQGSGRVDILKAAKKNSFITPASLSFGVVDLSPPIYSVKDTVWIYNFSSVQKSYNFSLSGSLPAGLDISFDQTTLLVNPQETKRVIISAIVNNNLLPFVNDNPPAYTGKVIAISASDTIKIPLAIIKSPILKITFDEEPLTILLHNRNDKGVAAAYPGKNLSILLPQGIYDLLVNYSDAQTHIIKEGINVSSLNMLDIKKSDAKNKVTMLTLDERGNNVYSNSGSEIFIHKSSKFGFTTFGGFQTDKYFSDFSDSYLWEWQARSYEYLRKLYSFNGYLNNGCSTDITQVNDPSTFKHIIYNYHLNLGSTAVFPLNYVGGVAAWNDQDPPLMPPFVQEAYLTPIPYPNFAKGDFLFSSVNYNEIYRYDGSPFDFFQAPLILQTPRLIVTNKDAAEVWMLGDSSAADKFSGITFNVNYGAPHWYGKMLNTPTELKLSDAADWLVFVNGKIFSRFFYFPFKDCIPLPDLTFQLYQGANLVDNGKVYDKANLTISVSPNEYTLKIPTDHYYIQGEKGNALVQLTFDTRKTDKNPPVLTSLKILTDSEITDIIKPTDNGSINFSVEDESTLSNVNLYIQSQGSTTWNTLNTNKNGSAYTANVPQNLSDGFVSLKILAEDAFNNKLEYEVNPAFYFGEGSNIDIMPPGPISDLNAKIDYEQNSAILKWTAQGDDNNIGTASKYDVRFSAVSPKNAYIDSTWFASARKIAITQTPKTAGMEETFPIQNIPLDTTFYFVIRTADEKSNWSPISNVVQIYLPKQVFFYQGVVEKINNNTLFIRADKQKNFLNSDTTLIVNTDAATRFTIRYIPSVLPSTGLGNDLFFQESALREDMLGKEVTSFSPNNIKGVINFYASNVDATNVYNLFVKIKSPTSLPAFNTENPLIDISGKIYSGTGKKISSFIVTNITNGTSKPDSSVKNKYSADFNITAISLLIGSNIIVATAKDSVGYIGKDTLVVNYSTTDVVDSQIPRIFSLQQNYPNPFNPVTIIKYAVPKTSFVNITVYDLLGREIVKLVNEEKPPGNYNIKFNGSNLTSGIYFYRLQSGGFSETKKLILLK